MLHPQAIKLPLGKCEVGDYILREARSRDAGALKQWRDRESAVLEDILALDRAVAHAKAENGLAFILVAPTGDRCGAFVIEVPRIDLIYLAPPIRGGDLGKRAASALFDHFFASELFEDDLEQSGSVIGEASSFTHHLGFVGRKLSRAGWLARRSTL